MTAIDFVSDLIIPLGLDDKISTGLRYMDENRVAHLPVTNQKKFLGIVAEDDLLMIDNHESAVHNLVSTLQQVKIDQHDHIYNAFKIISEKQIGLLPVTDSADFYLGSILREDMVNEASEILSAGNPGGVIVLQVSENDFSLSEVSRLVESNDVKILSVGIRSVPGASLLHVTLKLNKINIEPVIQTFNRFQYEIIAYFGENEKDEELLRERYDSLMQYLNI